MSEWIQRHDNAGSAEDRQNVVRELALYTQALIREGRDKELAALLDDIENHSELMKPLPAAIAVTAQSLIQRVWPARVDTLLGVAKDRSALMEVLPAAIAAGAQRLIEVGQVGDFLDLLVRFKDDPVMIKAMGPQKLAFGTERLISGGYIEFFSALLNNIKADPELMKPVPAAVATGVKWLVETGKAKDFSAVLNGIKGHPELMEPLPAAVAAGMQYLIGEGRNYISIAALLDNLKGHPELMKAALPGRDIVHISKSPWPYKRSLTIAVDRDSGDVTFFTGSGSITGAQKLKEQWDANTNPQPLKAWPVVFNALSALANGEKPAQADFVLIDDPARLRAQAQGWSLAALAPPPALRI